MSHRDKPGQKKDAVSNASRASHSSEYAEKTFDATRAALLEAERLLSQRAGFQWPASSPSHRETLSPSAPPASWTTMSGQMPAPVSTPSAAITAAREKEVHEIQVHRLRETEQFLNNEVVTLTTELANQRRESEERRFALETLQRSLETHKSEIDFLKQTSGRIVEISARMGVEKDQEIEKLRTFENHHASELADLNAKCAEQARSLREKAAAITELQTQITQLGQELKAVQTELSATKEQGNRKLSGLLDENWSKDIEVGRLRDGERELKAGFAQMEAEFRKTSQRLNDVSRELERAQHALLSGREERLKLVGDFEGAIEKLRKENSAATEALAFTKMQAGEFKSQLDSVTDALSNLQASYRSRTAELEQAQNFHEKQMAAITEDLKRVKVASAEDLRRSQIASAEELRRQQTSAQLEIDKIRAVRESEASRFNTIRADLEGRLKALTDTLAKADADFLSSQEIISALQASVNAQASSRADAESFAREIAAELARDQETAGFIESKLRNEIALSRQNEARLLRDIADRHQAFEAAAATARTEIAARQAALIDAGESFDFQRSKLESRLADAHDEIQKNHDEITKVEAELAQAFDDLAERVADVTKANAETTKIAADLHASRSYVLELERSLAEARSENAQRTHELAKTVDTNIDLKRVIETMTSAHRDEIETMTEDHRTEIDAYAARESHHREEITELRATNRDLQTDHRALNGTIQRLERELTDLRRAQIDFDQFQAKNESDRERLTTWGTQLETWNRQLESREFQLRRYANALTKEKTEALRFSKQIADEMKMARATHPLKDYLRLTEYELSKLELQAKKTPMLSPERPKLESALTQMIEQREFLKSVLGSTQRSLEHQANEFLKTIQSGRLAPVPPPPPRSGHVQPARPELHADPKPSPRLEAASPASRTVDGGATRAGSVETAESADATAALPKADGEFGFPVKWENLDQDLR